MAIDLKYHDFNENFANLLDFHFRFDQITLLLCTRGNEACLLNFFACLSDVNCDLNTSSHFLICIKRANEHSAGAVIEVYKYFADF